MISALLEIWIKVCLPGTQNPLNLATILPLLLLLFFFVKDEDMVQALLNVSKDVISLLQINLINQSKFKAMPFNGIISDTQTTSFSVSQIYFPIQLLAMLYVDWSFLHVSLFFKPSILNKLCDAIFCIFIMMNNDE